MKKILSLVLLVVSSSVVLGHNFDSATVTHTHTKYDPEFDISYPHPDYVKPASHAGVSLTGTTLGGTYAEHTHRHNAASHTTGCADVIYDFCPSDLHQHGSWHSHFYFNDKKLIAHCRSSGIHQNCPDPLPPEPEPEPEPVETPDDGGFCTACDPCGGAGKRTTADDPLCEEEEEEAPEEPEDPNTGGDGGGAGGSSGGNGQPPPLSLNEEGEVTTKPPATDPIQPTSPETTDDSSEPDDSGSVVHTAPVVVEEVEEEPAVVVDDEDAIRLSFYIWKLAIAVDDNGIEHYVKNVNERHARTKVLVAARLSATLRDTLEVDIRVETASGVDSTDYNIVYPPGLGNRVTLSEVDDERLFTVTFPPGTTEQSFLFQAQDDREQEDIETVAFFFADRPLSESSFTLGAPSYVIVRIHNLFGAGKEAASVQKASWGYIKAFFSD